MTYGFFFVMYSELSCIYELYKYFFFNIESQTIIIKINSPFLLRLFRETGIFEMNTE